MEHLVKWPKSITASSKCHGNFNLLTAISIYLRLFTIYLRQFQFYSREFQFTYDHLRQFQFGPVNFNFILTAISMSIRKILYMTITITISLSTLKRKLKQYKLHRNKVDFDPQLRIIIVEIIDGPGLLEVHFCWLPQRYLACSPVEGNKIRSDFPYMVVQLGMNRKVLWRYVTRSNNLPDNIAASYLNAVREHGGCPLNYIPTWAQKMELWLVLFFFNSRE